jgi:hypothetical protein
MNSKVKLVDCQKIFIDNVKADDEFDIFNENFEITKNDMDRVKSSEIQEFLKRKILICLWLRFQIILLIEVVYMTPINLEVKLLRGLKV